jgi:hypothetical protein
VRLAGRVLGLGIIAAVGVAHLGLKLVPEPIKQRVRFGAIKVYLKMQGVQ